jgi:hypothetical protein
MSARTLLTIGIVWFGAVVLWMRFGPESFGYYWPAKGISRTLSVAAVYLLGLLYQLFVVGWVVPIGLGVYRLVKKH